MSIQLLKAILMQALYQKVCEKAGFELDRGQFLRAVVDVAHEKGISSGNK